MNDQELLTLFRSSTENRRRWMAAYEREPSPADADRYARLANEAEWQESEIDNLTRKLRYKRFPFMCWMVDDIEDDRATARLRYDRRMREIEERVDERRDAAELMRSDPPSAEVVVDRPGQKAVEEVAPATVASAESVTA